MCGVVCSFLGGDFGVAAVFDLGLALARCRGRWVLEDYVSLVKGVEMARCGRCWGWRLLKKDVGGHL